VTLTGKVNNGDFLSDSALSLRKDLFFLPDDRFLFDIAILNPPYRKITSTSSERRTLRSLGIETTNLYTGFLSCALRALTPGGQLIAITPRSFCNGSYFRPFREDLLCRSTLTHLHVFSRRSVAFQDDAVLQETVIFRAVTKPFVTTDSISVAHLEMPPQKSQAQCLPQKQIIRPDDPERFIHIPQEDTSERAYPFSTSLSALGLSVSTGRVVDFRAASYLRTEPSTETMPLLYPVHCSHSDIRWPISGGKKPNALLAVPETASLSIPNGNYVFIKRFSAKEQPRRLLATLYEAEWFPEADTFGIGLENHLNYFHRNGNGLEKHLARGLALYLSSTAIDLYFRRFSGHTQVNATDLRNLPYPTQVQLEALGKRMGESFPDTTTIDKWVAELTS
jgi:adenine-specific DNA-methyltransferase